MYKKFFRFVGVICFYLWFVHCLTTHYIAIGILVCTLLICITYHVGRKRKKQNKINAQITKKFKQLNNSDLVSYRKNISPRTGSTSTEIYEKECMRRFGFIERK